MSFQQNISPTWFEDWFESEYYHILYNERGRREAKLFLDNLNSFLQLKSHHQILDLACGRGRHANYLASMGLPVTGLDLSVSSIKYAKKHRKGNASFHIHDMREPFGVNSYQIILNLFTSFGYFEDLKDNILVINNIANALMPEGKVIIDYFNSNYLKQHLVQQEIKKTNGVKFFIKKMVQENFVYKHIRFIDKGEEYIYAERVMLIALDQIESWLKNRGLQLVQVFGNYQLDMYCPNTSPRMIIIAEKN